MAGVFIFVFRKAGYSYTGLIIRDKELKFIGVLNREKVVAADDIYEVAISAHSKKSAVVKFFYQEGDKHLSQKFNVSGMEDLKKLVKEIRDFAARNGIDRTEILKKNLAGNTARIVEEIDFEKAGVKYNRSRDFFDNKPGFLELGFAGFMFIVVIVKLFPILPLSLGIKAIILLGFVGLIGLFYRWGYNLVYSALFAMLSPIMISLLLGLLFLLGEKLIDFFQRYNLAEKNLK